MIEHEPQPVSLVDWEKRMLTRQEVMALFGISRATVYRWSASGILPKAKTIGETTTRWVGAEIAFMYPELLGKQAAE